MDFDLFLLVVVGFLFLVGLVGAIVPVLPGAILIFGGAVIHKLWAQESVSWEVIIILGVALALSFLTDFLGGPMGAKFFGGSKWGMLGAAVGFLVGLFFALPGILIGPPLGAFLFEVFLGKKEIPQALKASFGVGIGFLFSVGTRLIISLGMIIYWVIEYSKVCSQAQPVF